MSLRNIKMAPSSKTAPRILIFSIAMGADYSFYVKTIETYARTFLALNISAIGTVSSISIDMTETSFSLTRSNKY